jgi:hypothetical protein
MDEKRLNVSSPIRCPDPLALWLRPAFVADEFLEWVVYIVLVILLAILARPYPVHSPTRLLCAKGA